MQLIAPLACGIAAAASGTAEVYARGTSARATVYTTFEASGADSSGEDILLDDDGAATVYVNQVVDVVVRNSVGEVVRRFTCGVGAGSVEIISQSIIGTDYDSGQQAAGKPTTLARMVDLFYATFGGANFLLNGLTTLASAFGAATGLAYNVRSYGAVGDGVTDDRAAIAAAISAAQSAGGGTVFFPPGIYCIGSTVTMSSLVSFQGAGAAISVIRITAAGAQLAARNVLRDLAIDSSVNLSGAFVTAVSGFSGSRLSIGSYTFTATACVGTNSVVRLDDCDLIGAGQTQIAVGVAGGSLNATLTNCRVYNQASTYTGTLFPGTANGQTTVTATRIELQCSTGGGTVFSVDSSGSPQNSWSLGHNILTLPFLATTAITWCAFGGTTVGAFAESGNAFYSLVSSLVTPFAAGTTNFATTACQFVLASRDKYSRSYSDNSAGLTIESLAYGLITVERTNNGAQTVTFDPAPVGARLTLIYYNNHAGAGGTITFDTTRVDMVAASNQFAIAANSYRVFQFESRLIGTNLRWVEVEMAAADEPE